MKESLSKSQIEYWLSLDVGHQVEVCDELGVVQLMGTVETTAADIGVIWIRTDYSDRKLLDIQHDFVRPRQRQDAGTQ